MSVFKRVVAGIVIALSIVGLLLSVAGIAVTWVVEAQVSSAVQNVLMGLETRLDTTSERLGRLEAALGQVRGEVGAVQENIEALGADIQENKPLVTALSTRVREALSPAVERVREITDGIRELVAAVVGVIEAVNAMPFVSLPEPELPGLVKVAEDVENMRAQVEALRTAFDVRQGEIVQGAVDILTAPTSAIGSALEGARSRVADLEQNVVETRADIAALRSRVVRWLVVAAVAITLALLWIAFAQVSLLLNAWSVFTGRDLLAGLRQRPA